MTARPHSPVPGLNTQDILLALFKHKWKLVFITTASLVGALGVYLRSPTLYQSEAKLLVRYVVDKSAIDKIDSTASSSRVTETMSSEAEILGSWDLAEEVAATVGPERLVGKSPGPANAVTGAQ